MTYDEKKERAAEMIRAGHGIARTKELTAAGISYKAILRMVSDGTLRRAKSGYYMLPEEAFAEEELVCALYGDGVLTMESALYYHGYLTKRPKVWRIAVSKNTSKSRFLKPPVEVEPFYTEERVLPIGAEEMPIGAGNMGIDDEDAAKRASDADQKDAGLSLRMKIYGIDRLICDVLKYEEKLERADFKAAVRAYIDDEKKDVARLLSYAKERKVLKKVQTMIGVWL